MANQGEVVKAGLLDRGLPVPRWKVQQIAVALLPYSRPIAYGSPLFADPWKNLPPEEQEGPRDVKPLHKCETVRWDE